MVIDTVRASRDGHQFHEAWVARCALALLLPRNGLYAIAVEGLAEEDEEDVSGEKKKGAKKGKNRRRELVFDERRGEVVAKRKRKGGRAKDWQNYDEEI